MAHQNKRHINYIQAKLNDKKFILEFKQLYNNYSIDSVCKRLHISNRNVVSLASRLRLKKKTTKEWSREELKILYDEYKSYHINIRKLLILLPGRSRFAIYHAAMIHGLKKIKPPVINLNNLLLKKNLNMYLCGLMFGGKSLRNVDEIKQCRFGFGRNNIKSFVDITKYIGVVYGDHIAIQSLHVKNFLKNFYNNNTFDLSFIEDDRLFIHWFIGFMDRSYHYHKITGIVIKQCSMTVDTIKYCIHRINLILNINIKDIKLLDCGGISNCTIYISKNELIKLKFTLDKLSIHLGHFWKAKYGSKEEV